jgi:Peptidase propeptide and YPEB domain
MQRKTKWIAGGALVVALIGGGTGVAVAGGSGDDGADGGPLTGSTHDKAVAAALEETGGGTVTEAEVADDGGAYSVEVELDNGSHVEVKLDEHFRVIDQVQDDDGPNDNDGANGD